MPRQTRLISPGDFYHVTARGNFKQDVFFCADDRTRYLGFLQTRSAKAGLDILGWCLMTNHIHLLVVPQKADSLSTCMQRVQGQYSSYLNRVHGRRSGHVWQNRFYSCPVASDRVWRVLSYIELNPCRAGMVRQPEQYPWSTAGCRAGLEPWPQMLQSDPWATMYTGTEWMEVLRLGVDPEESDAIRTATRYGVPWGDQAFVSRFEQMAGRRLEIRPRGRPRNTPLEV